MPGERAAHPAHASHEPFLIARYVDDDASPAERTRVETLIASCSSCRELADDLRALQLSLSTDMPIPRRTRDFRLSPADAERARSASPWDRFLRWAAGPKLGVLQPLGAAALSIGIAVTVVSGLGIAPGGSMSTAGDAPAAAVAAPPTAGGAPRRTQAPPEREGVTAAGESPAAALASPAATTAATAAAATNPAPDVDTGAPAAESPAATSGAGQGAASPTRAPGREVPGTEIPVDTEGAPPTDGPRVQATSDPESEDGRASAEPTEVAYVAPGSTASTVPNDPGAAAPARPSDAADYRPVGIALALSGLLAILLRTYARRRPGDPFTR